jgi:putative superfamily III holin-X
MAAHTEQQPTAQLIEQLSGQISVLVRDELTLARLEMTEKGKRAGVGAGLFGAAGLVALYGVGALLVTGGAALALVMPVWTAVLVVAAVVIVVAGIASLMGRKQVKSAMPPRPLSAVESGKQDVQAMKAAIQR